MVDKLIKMQTFLFNGVLLVYNYFSHIQLIHKLSTNKVKYSQTQNLKHPFESNGNSVHRMNLSQKRVNSKLEFNDDKIRTV